MPSNTYNLENNSFQKLEDNPFIKKEKLKQTSSTAVAESQLFLTNSLLQHHMISNSISDDLIQADNSEDVKIEWLFS